ncbi:MAG: peptidoglycan-binding domain-containing protein [Leptolyngbyaceae cyanobacterium bins.302]|nr:peptidoglycan-binding domain-containing protein [Leptolyngbyaceae cyanobacterium bins.302]
MQVSTSSPRPLISCDTMPILRRNDRQASANDSVKTLQRRLNEYGFKLTVDGFFGAKTESAVLEFQGRGNDHDSSVLVDGIVGPQTWNALRLCTIPVC